MSLLKDLRIIPNKFKVIKTFTSIKCEGCKNCKFRDFSENCIYEFQEKIKKNLWYTDIRSRKPISVEELFTFEELGYIKRL